MLNKSAAALVAVALGLLGCSSDGDTGVTDTAKQPLAGSTAYGTVPAGLPPRLAVGLFSDHGDTWMRDSGVKWDMRYRYFTKGWVNNWGYGNYDGGWALSYMQETDTQGFVPAIQYYQMNGEPGGGESAFYAKTKNATTMRSYFGDFKILMQRAKDFGKPVVVLLEADGFAYMEQQSAENPNAYSAVADTGLAELAGLPNTAAGWGLAFLQLKKSVGATNAHLGVHISAWASGKDVAHFNVTDPLQPEVTKVYNFLAKLGLGSNVTGLTYDLLVGDPLDRDADYYRLVQGQDRWWDPSDTAPVTSKSFNRYAEWLRLWNQTAQKRWVLWQIPLGNSNHLNVENKNGPREGYKDNRPEYFFGNGTAHLTKFADAGVIALLFGAGMGGQSWYTNDYYSDGQLFMKSRAGAILNAGGVPIATGSGAVVCPAATRGTGTGLTGDYFAATRPPTVGTTPAKTRLDPTVNFTWGAGSPDPAVPANGFSARWRGKVQPRFSGNYTFFTTSDDGVRLWVNGRAIVDNWTNHGPTENSGTISLSAGVQYDVLLEYFENTGDASLKLAWASADGCEPKAIIPATQLYPVSAAPSDSAQYGFESGTQSWTASGAMITAVSSSTTRAYAGTRSLALTLSGAGPARVAVGQPATPAGRTVNMWLYVPANSGLTSVQPFVLQGASGGWAWTGSWTAGSALTAGSWNKLTVTVPTTAAVPLYQLGLEFSGTAPANTTLYLDAVSW